MDLNPTSASQLPEDVTPRSQDGLSPRDLPTASLDKVLTSDAFGHLPDEGALGRTLDQEKGCLKRGGQLIDVGTRIKFLPGRCAGFGDHYLPMTELSVRAALAIRGFQFAECALRFLPYTVSGAIRFILFCVRLFLLLRPFWTLFGRQFLVVSRP